MYGWKPSGDIAFVTFVLLYSEEFEDEKKKEQCKEFNTSELSIKEF